MDSQQRYVSAMPPDTGFKIERDPDTVRAPDVAFVARERLADIPDEGYAELAPDWVAEILSPSDRRGFGEGGPVAGRGRAGRVGPRPGPPGRAHLPRGRNGFHRRAGRRAER